MGMGLLPRDPLASDVCGIVAPSFRRPCFRHERVRTVDTRGGAAAPVRVPPPSTWLCLQPLRTASVLVVQVRRRTVDVQIMGWAGRTTAVPRSGHTDVDR